MTDRNSECLPAESVITAMAETWAELTGIADKLKSIPSNLPTKEMQERHDELVLRHVKLTYEEGVASGWQAAAAHYTPKLTRAEAVEVCRDVYRHARKGELWPGIVAALRAAGVRFKEEA